MPFVAPPPPVSYSRQIAPVLALRCYGCHGDSGGLNLRTYADLMRGGNLGKALIPGDAEQSLLIHFIEGRRGEAHRMPLGGRSLSPAQIGMFRRWIDAGAKPDSEPESRPTRVLRNIEMVPGRTLAIFCRVNTDSLLIIRLRDPGTGRTLFSDVASIKRQKEQVDAGKPGELISWNVRTEPGWPRFVNVELRVEYPIKTPMRTELFALRK
ncbi:MAG: hypothetical protein M3Z36_08045 [Acidobacteriota bacterium]|nr:hypothetical protein [Acidobacteriota bacterium]